MLVLVNNAPPVLTPFTFLLIAEGKCEQSKQQLLTKKGEQNIKMVYVLIITHGCFGKELLRSAELIMGEQQDAKAICLNLGDEVEALRNEVEDIIIKNKNLSKETIIFVDVLGGSPSNVALYMSNKYGTKVITGVNLPMLLELFASRNTDTVEELIDKAFKSGIGGINKI